MPRTKKPVESVRGTYSALPHAVLDSRAYTGASPAAKALLNELVRQHRGANNGKLHLSSRWLALRGWPSKSIVEKARNELIERGLIIQTKQGGLFVGASWYALTWLDVTNYAGLDIVSSQYHRGAWMLCDRPPTARRKPPVKKISLPDHRGSTDPTTGEASRSTDPTTGAITPVSGGFPAPTTGDDVYIPLPPAENPAGTPAPATFPAMRRSGWRPVGQPARAQKPHVNIFPGRIDHNHARTGTIN